MDLQAEINTALSPLPTQNVEEPFNIDIARPALPNVERWYATLQQRPAYRDHVMLPFDELYGRLGF